MEELRYTLGLVLILLMPVVIIFWLVIHLGAQLWRKTPVLVPYICAGVCIGVTISLLLSSRRDLIGEDLGDSVLLFTIGLLIYALSFSLWRPIKRHLNFRTFAGVPEVSNQPIPLIKDGPFALVRHPRYLMVIISIVGWCLMTNFLGVYLVGIASIIGLIVIVRLEERDLVARFAEQYITYRSEVPAILPSWKSFKTYLSASGDQTH